MTTKAKLEWNRHYLYDSCNDIVASFVDEMLSEHCQRAMLERRLDEIRELKETAFIECGRVIWPDEFPCTIEVETEEEDGVPAEDEIQAALRDLGDFDKGEEVFMELARARNLLDREYRIQAAIGGAIGCGRYEDATWHESVFGTEDIEEARKDLANEIDEARYKESETFWDDFDRLVERAKVAEPGDVLAIDAAEVAWKIVVAEKP